VAHIIALALTGLTAASTTPTKQVKDVCHAAATTTTTHAFFECLLTVLHMEIGMVGSTCCEYHVNSNVSGWITQLLCASFACMDHGILLLQSRPAHEE
jgi:hypothetical protein